MANQKLWQSLTKFLIKKIVSRIGRAIFRWWIFPKRSRMVWIDWRWKIHQRLVCWQHYEFCISNVIGYKAVYSLSLQYPRLFRRRWRSTINSGSNWRSVNFFSRSIIWSNSWWLHHIKGFLQQKLTYKTLTRWFCGKAIAEKLTVYGFSRITGVSFIYD